MKFESELILRLLQGAPRILQRVENPQGFALEIATEKGVYMARVSKTQLDDLAVRATSGDPDAMYVVSMLYDLGMGLPENKTAASDWSNFSVLQSGNVTFDVACKALKTDIANSVNAIKGDFVYPSAYMRAMEKFTRFLSFNVYQKLEITKGTSIRMSPFLSGVQVAACYRRTKDEGYVLYDMWTLEEQRMLPSISHFGSRILPMKLGEWFDTEQREIRGGFKGKYGKYVFVYGTLAVRQDRVAAMHEVWPDIRSVRELLELYLKMPPPNMNLFDDGELTKLQSAYRSVKKRYVRTGKNVDEYRSARDAYRAAKNKLEEEKALYQKRRPEGYLDFVAYDMFGYEKGQLLHLTEVSSRFLKLQSSGFTVPRVPAFTDATFYASSDEDFRSKRKAVFKRMSEAVPYRLLGLEVLELDKSALNADHRIVYKLKDK